MIKKNKSRIINIWLKKFTDTYSEQSGKFFRDNQGQFSNPVGYTFRVNMEKIFDELFLENDQEKMSEYVDGITRIRAVQGFPPSVSVSFVPMLRESIWEVCGREIAREGMHQEWLELNVKFEELMQLAFDTYMSCRELLWKQRADFLHTRTHKLLERAGFITRAGK